MNLNQKNNLTLQQTLLAAAVLILLIIFLLLTWQSLQRCFSRISADYFYPWFKLTARTENFVSGQVMSLKKSRSQLAAMVDVLQKENIRLASETETLRGLKKENDQLRALLQLQVPENTKSVCAEIIIRDPLTWNEYFTVDKGTDEGIQEGDPVLSIQLSADGQELLTTIAGRVIQVSRHTAKVATVLTPECTLGVLLPESGQYGILSGKGGSRTPVITSLPVTGKYAAGEMVVTGGFSSQVPPGLYLGTLQGRRDGTVTRVLNHLYAEGNLKAAAALESLRFVGILTRKKK